MSTHTLYQVIKTLLVWLYPIIAVFTLPTGGGNFEPSQPVEPGDSSRYLRIEAIDEGINIYTPREEGGGYRYGPSMILNKDGSLDTWCATDGPGDIWDMISYSRLYDGGKRSSGEVLPVKPAGGAFDSYSTCDPGAIYFGGYYYIGYTTTLDERGVDNDVCVARSKKPGGPYEKWTGSGWGAEPAPMIDYNGNPDEWGAGEPSFVLMGDKLYVYYSWNDGEVTTRLSIADATDENWPATLEFKGTCLTNKNGGDSADVKYSDEYGRFLAVFTMKRFSPDSYISVWESFDGLNFRQCSVIKTNTQKCLHNCGISGRADGHIAAGDPVYIGYAYDNCGAGAWATRLHQVRLFLADEPQTDDTAQQNIATPFDKRPVKAVPQVLTIKSEDQVYNISKSKQVWVLTYDNDGYIFPVLTGVRFYGYDRSVVRIVGGRLFPVGEGSTRVFICWHGVTDSFLVNVTK